MRYWGLGRRRRPGFSIIEIIVAVGLLAIVAATIFSTVNLEKDGDSARIAALAQNLEDLMQAIAGSEITLPATSFRQTVKVFPGNLTNLTSALTPLNAAVSKNSCGQPYTNTNVSAAGTSGPYYPIEFLAAGTKLADGFVASDAIVRANPATTTRSTIAIQFANVSLTDAQAIDGYMDGVIDGTIGAIQYTMSGSNPVTVSFVIAVRGC